MIEQLFYIGLGTVIGGLIAYVVRDRWLDARIMRLETALDDLEEENMRLRNNLAGRKGQDIKQEKGERMQSALMEATIMFKEGKQPVEIMKELAMKYPDIAMDLAKKGLKL